MAHRASADGTRPDSSDGPADRREPGASTRRQRRWVAGSLAVAVAAIGLATFALIQWDRAEAELRTATAQRLAVESRTALADALQPGGLVRPDVDRSALVALESLKVERSVEADRALRTALLHLSGPAREIRVERDLELVALGPDGAWVAVAGWHEPPVVLTQDGVEDPTPEQQAVIDLGDDALCNQPGARGSGRSRLASRLWPARPDGRTRYLCRHGPGALRPEERRAPRRTATRMVCQPPPHSIRRGLRHDPDELRECRSFGHRGDAALRQHAVRLGGARR